MEDAQCADMNEKSYSRFFWFLVFEIWSSKDETIWLHKKIVQKQLNLQERCVMSWANEKFNFLIFSFWDMVNFVLKFVKIMLGGFRPSKPPVLWGASPLTPPNVYVGSIPSSCWWFLLVPQFLSQLPVGFWIESA